MKAIIENPVTILHSESSRRILWMWFHEIIKAITESSNEKELRENMKKEISSCMYFQYGFGHNHMWVHQKDINLDTSDVNENKRIIVVYF